MTMPHLAHSLSEDLDCFNLTPLSPNVETRQDVLSPGIVHLPGRSESLAERLNSNLRNRSAEHVQERADTTGMSDRSEMNNALVVFQGAKRCLV